MCGSTSAKKCLNKLFNAADKKVKEEDKEEKVQEEIKSIEAELAKELAAVRKQAGDLLRDEVDEALEVSEASTFNREIVQFFSRVCLSFSIIA